MVRSGSIEMSDIDDRIVRIEQKIDKLAELLVSVARVEEKVATLKDDHDAQETRMHKFADRLDEIERMVMDNNRTVKVINKLAMAAVIAAVGTFVAQMWM